MRPTSENVKVALLEHLSNDHKIAALSAREANPDDAQARFCDLTERLKKIARQVPSGIDELSRPNQQPGNYELSKLHIVETAEGWLDLHIFMYAPKNTSYGRSIYAAWTLEKGDQSRIILEEYVSDRSFVPGIAAYNPAAPKAVCILEDSLETYEKTYSLGRVSLTDRAKKFSNFVLKHIHGEFDGG